MRIAAFKYRKSRGKARERGIRPRTAARRAAVGARV